MRVLVIGDSGVVGRPTASVLHQRGHQVAVLSRGGGPRVERLPDLARQLARKRGLGRTVVPVWVPGKAGRAIRGSAQLPGPGAVLRGPTFAQWLNDQ